MRIDSALRSLIAAALLGGLLTSAPARAADNAFLCYSSSKGAVVSCVGGPARVVGYSAGNENNASPSFVQVFNVPAASVVLGTTQPVFVIPMPANLGRERSLTYALPLGGTGLSFACTTTETGNVAPSNNCDVRIDYQ